MITTSSRNLHCQLNKDQTHPGRAVLIRKTSQNQEVLAEFQAIQHQIIKGRQKILGPVASVQQWVFAAAVLKVVTHPECKVALAVALYHCALKNHQ